MYYIILLFAAVALLSGGRSTNVNRHMKLLGIMDNHLEPNAVPIRNSSSKKFISLTKKPPAITVHEVGTTLELTCEALAAPAPSIHWFRNDAPVYEWDLESNEVVDSNPTSLARLTSTLLVPRGVRGARGVRGERGERGARGERFACVVAAGAARQRASVVVVGRADGSTDLSERSKLVPLAPRILVSYKVFVDVIGTNVILPCRVRGHPRPHVVWKNPNSTIVTEDPRMKVLRSGELVISNLRWTDMGEYRCHATNIFGTTNTTTFIYPAKPSKTNG